MEQDLKDLIKENLELTKENNELLRLIRRRQKFEDFFFYLKWILIIGISFGALYFLEPYAAKILKIYDNLSATNSKLNIETVNELLKPK